jgi:hypothetical protein
MESELAEFERELGSWRRDDQGLAAVVGQVVTNSSPLMNEVGELVGIQVEFGNLQILLRVFCGDIRVEIVE